MINHIIKSYVKRRSHKTAFTLVEVLLAVVIVGIIAALVLPAVYTQYQTKVFDYKKTRQMQALESVISQLKTTENVKSFMDTPLYTKTTYYVIDEKPGKFINKYLRVAKYCGGSSVNGTSECFAPEYYEYSNGDKKVVPAKNLELNGACAQLKNGTSLCITPQKPGNNPIMVVMDLNGPKGPNIVGRDFITARGLDLVDTSSDLADKGTDDTVLAQDETVIIPDQENMCRSTTDFSDACCEYKLQQGLIKHSNDSCCGNVNYAGSIPVCYKEADIHVNYYPTGGTIPGTVVSGGKQVWANAASNTKIVPDNLRIPEGLTIRVKCGDGSISNATLTSDTLQKAIDTKKGNFYFNGLVYNTSCYFPKETLVWDHPNATDGGTTIAYKGLIYHLYQH